MGLILVVLVTAAIIMLLGYDSSHDLEHFASTVSIENRFDDSYHSKQSKTADRDSLNLATAVRPGNLSSTLATSRMEKLGSQLQDMWPTVTGEALTKLLEKASHSPLKDSVGGIEFYWQMPPSRSDAAYSDPPNAILFLAHGCHHAGSDWWPYDPKVCPECLGLPEERAIVDLAHSSKFRMVTIAMSSNSEGSRKCWGNRDGPRVSVVLERFQTLFADIPTFAFGASSGGRFVNAILPTVMMKRAARPLDAYISQIMGPSMKATVSDGIKMPAMAFITMPKDNTTRRNVIKFVKQQKQRNRPTMHIPVKAHAISPSFFHDRIPAISEELSSKLFNALKNDNFLDPQTFELTHDPRHYSEWRNSLRSVLQEASTYTDGLKPDLSPISEVMNVAYGMHEMTRDGVAEALEWVLEMYKTTSVPNAESKF